MQPGAHHPSTVRFTVRLSLRERQQLERFAEGEGLTLSTVIREALYDAEVLRLSDAPAVVEGLDSRGQAQALKPWVDRMTIKAAGVKPIKFHGLRHTCATLLLSAGVPVHVVSKRLGHKSVATTLEIYAHALPSQQADAASKLAARCTDRPEPCQAMHTSGC